MSATKELFFYGPSVVAVVELAAKLQEAGFLVPDGPQGPTEFGDLVVVAYAGYSGYDAPDEVWGRELRVVWDQAVALAQATACEFDGWGESLAPLEALVAEEGSTDHG